MRSVVVMAAVLLPGLAAADCAGTVILACPVVGSEKVIEVCADTKGFTYAFGPAGAPELTLAAPYADGPVTPWAGVGRAIWSGLRFGADGYAYDVWISVDRLTENAPVEGGVLVMSLPDEAIVAEVTCRPGTVAGEIFGPEDAMADAGYCWNLDAQVWQAGSCG